MSGLEDTRRIVEAQADTDGMTAAKRCWEYKNGGLQWYLPSLMELGVIYMLRDEINEAMERLDCSSDCLLPTEDSDEAWIWSSSEYSQFYSWYVNFCSGNFYGYYKCYTFIVRAVAMLPEEEDELHVCTLEGFSSIELAAELRSRGYKGELTKKDILIV